MTSSVWLFTRPLSHVINIASFASLSDGKPFLRHWGVLISEMSYIDFIATSSRTKGSRESEFAILGTMYELFRGENDYNDVAITRPFGVDNIRDDWQMYSFDYVGQTDRLHDMIISEGRPLLK